MQLTIWQCGECVCLFGRNISRRYRPEVSFCGSHDINGKNVCEFRENRIEIKISTMFLGQLFSEISEGELADTCGGENEMSSRVGMLLLPAAYYGVMFKLMQRDEGQ